ncbi:hypothetical protein C7E18_22490, partial [Stenotrophomonas maltophilia]
NQWSEFIGRACGPAPAEATAEAKARARAGATADAIVERLKALQQRTATVSPRAGWDNPALREPVV